MLNGTSKMFGDENKRQKLPIQRARPNFDLQRVPTDTGFEVLVDKNGCVWIADQHGEQIGNDDTANYLNDGEIGRVLERAGERD